MRYDPKAETVVTCEAVNGGACNPSFGAGTVRITGASAAGLSGMQTLAEITFEPTGHAKATSPLTLVATTLTDPAGIAMAVAGVTPAGASPTPTTPPIRTSGSGAGGP